MLATTNLLAVMFAQLLSSPPPQERGGELFKKVEKLCVLGNLQEQELLFRSETSQGRLGELGAVYRSLFFKKSEPKYLYGLLRCEYTHMEFLRFRHTGLYYSALFFDMRSIPKALETIPQKLAAEPMALAAYYEYVRQFRESTLQRPKVRSSKTLVTVGGKQQEVEVMQVLSDEPKAKRLDELFATMDRLSKSNPMVLRISAERASNDPSLSYLLMKKAYDGGGRQLFPELALYHLYEKSSQLKRSAVATKYKNELLNWLRTNKGSVWADYFYCCHPTFPRV